MFQQTFTIFKLYRYVINKSKKRKDTCFSKTIAIYITMRLLFSS